MSRAAASPPHGDDVRAAKKDPYMRWDCLAAGRAGIPLVAVLTAGFSEAELRKAARPACLAR